jgi:hypothetical protein
MAAFPCRPALRRTTEKSAWAVPGHSVASAGRRAAGVRLHARPSGAFERAAAIDQRALATLGSRHVVVRLDHTWMPRVRAPSTTRFVPLIRRAERLARNTTGRATSSGVPICPVGLRSTAIL